MLMELLDWINGNGQRVYSSKDINLDIILSELSYSRPSSSQLQKSFADFPSTFV